MEGCRGGAGVGATCGATAWLDGLTKSGDAAAGAICLTSKPAGLVTVECELDAGTCEQAARTATELMSKSLSLGMISY